MRSSFKYALDDEPLVFFIVNFIDIDIPKKTAGQLFDKVTHASSITNDLEKVNRCELLTCVLGSCKLKEEVSYDVPILNA